MPRLDAILHAARATIPDLIRHSIVLEREAAVRNDPPDLAGALRRADVGVIAEIKRRSPSAGPINQGLVPVELAGQYQQGGAAAISVLTNGPFFGGSVADLRAVCAATDVPVIRKDFVVDEAQILEARAAGASGVLLIVRVLDQQLLARLIEAAAAMHLTPLVETHAPGEVDRAIDAGARVIGVNSRDLDSFRIDADTAWRQLELVPPDCIAVAESGMSNAADVAKAGVAGADAVLIGTALSASADPMARLRELAGVPRRGR